jgi:predicted PurR-regulated permease PerM
VRTACSPGYFKGLLFESGFIGIACVIGFYLVGLPYALLLGLFVGLTDIVPYLGPLIAGVLVGIIGFAQSPTTGLLAILVVVVVQQFESVFIGPRVQAEAVGLHPVVIIIALLAGASIGGTVGMIVAIPIAGLAYAVWVYFDARYKWTTLGPGVGAAPREEAAPEGQIP